MRLGRVFDHLQTVSRRQLVNRIHVSRLAIEVSWDDSFRSRSDRLLDLSRINIVGSLIRFDGYRLGAGSVAYEFYELDLKA